MKGIDVTSPPALPRSFKVLKYGGRDVIVGSDSDTDSDSDEDDLNTALLSDSGIATNDIGAHGDI